MSVVRDIQVRAIQSGLANAFVKKHHYSGKVAPNSQLHFGAFLGGRLHGVMSFGASLDKAKIQGLVKNTGWNEFIELNRMAFDDTLPKNNESRCLGVAIRLIKKYAPHVKWIVSFADGTQCGDGTIYRASNFVLTKIGKNTTIGYSEKLGEVVAKHGTRSAIQGRVRLLDGFQLRYIYFIDKKKQGDLTVPILPYSAIDDFSAGMYKGKRISLAERKES
ncbi:hypothetical protein EKI60_06635 [Candidatus Saccharibacteria bacterium]|nr:MAG: hypothetical protein EKI60_06635 [Candidatus Saccharibacteria bacterium]